MFQIKKVITLPSLLLFVACLPNEQATLNPLSFNQESDKSQQFQTNLENFVASPFHENATKEERDNFIKEFILQSNLQCQHHLRHPSNSYQKSQAEQELYMTIFDTVSMIFGVSHITESAKRALMPNTQESSIYQKEYQTALTPEILKGVELGRSRYAKTLLKKTSLTLDTYDINQLKEDMSKYDKQCNQTYGLIEINRALMALQQTIEKSPNETTSKEIDPVVVKRKVEAVTKEVERQQQGRKKVKERAVECIKREITQ